MNLNLENIDNLFQDNLETMEITPSPSVKQAIKKRMYYRNIVKATYFKVASSVIVLSIIATIILLNTPDKNINETIANNQNTKISTTSIIDNNNDNSKEVNLQEIKTSDKINDTKEVSRTNNSNEEIIIAEKPVKTSSVKNKPINNINKTPVVLNETENPNMDNKILASNNNIKPAKKTNAIVNQNTNNKTKKTTFTIPVSEINTDIQTENNSKENTFAIEKSKSKSSLGLTAQTAKISIEKIDHRNAILLNQSNELHLPIINVPDDTIGFTMSGEEIVVKSNHWFVGLNMSPNYSFTTYSVNNQENSNLVDKLNSSSSNSLAFDLGAEIGYQFKNISLISGINFTQYNEQFNAEYEENLIQDINYWEYNNYTQTIYDTTNYVNIDSLIQGDTTYTQIIDSTQITLTDSSLTSTSDTSTSKQNMKYVNKYKYIEIPLTIEFTFNRVKKFSPFVRTGLITGLHIKTQGFTYSVENNEQIIENTDLPYVKANFWLLFGAGVRYNLNDKFSILVYPYYRYHLNDIINDKTYYRQSLNNMGIKFGVRYMF